MSRIATTVVSLAAAALLSVNAHAALIDRGNGMIYDTALNITWLQDMNYPKTLDPTDTTGSMYYDQALMWADQLEYGGFDDWRLPSARLIGNETTSTDGSTDIGWNNHRSELGHLYYVDLQNTSDGFVNPGNFTDGLTGQPKSFLNLTDNVYWFAEPGSSAYGTLFDNWDGYQFMARIGDGRASVALVRDGDVATVPVPSAVWLLSSALFGLAGLARRKNVR